MSYLGLTPSEYSSGRTGAKVGSPKAGNSHARRALVEGAWAYRYPAKVSRHLQLRLEKLPCEVQQVVVAIAREMAAFAWAIARTVPVAS
jgi:transposase